MHKEIGRRLEIERHRDRQGDRNKELGRWKETEKHGERDRQKETEIDRETKASDIIFLLITRKINFPGKFRK